MKVALVQVNEEASITHLEALTPDMLVDSAEEAHQRLRDQGYTEACSFRSVGHQLFVFVHDEDPAEDRLKARLAALDAEVKELKAERESAKELKLARLVEAHNILCTAESDHHEIDQCRCSLALTWRATKES